MGLSGSFIHVMVACNVGTTGIDQYVPVRQLTSTIGWTAIANLGYIYVLTNQPTCKISIKLSKSDDKFDTKPSKLHKHSKSTSCLLNQCKLTYWTSSYESHEFNNHNIKLHKLAS